MSKTIKKHGRFRYHGEDANRECSILRANAKSAYAAVPSPMAATSMKGGNEVASVTKAQREAELWIQRVIENTPKKKAAGEKYRKAVSECNYSYCMHFDEDRRRCALRYCFYDRKHSAVSESIGRRS